MNKLPIVQTGKNFIKSGNISGCIDTIDNWFGKNQSEEKIWKEMHNEFINISYQRNAYSKKNNLNTIPYASAQNTENKIVNSLLEFLDKIEELNKKFPIVTYGHSVKENKKQDESYDVIKAGIGLKVTTELTIDRKFESYSEKEKQSLLKKIKQLLESDTDLKIISLHKGSVKLSIELTTKQHERLDKAIDKGELKDFDVVDSDMVLKIKFPDATYTLVKFELQGTTLFAYYSYEDTHGDSKVPYVNSYNLSVFNITGKIDDIKFVRVS